MPAARPESNPQDPAGVGIHTHRQPHTDKQVNVRTKARHTNVGIV